MREQDKEVERKIKEFDRELKHWLCTIAVSALTAMVLTILATR